MTTIRTRLPLPLLVLLALAPFLITGIWVCGPQFMRLEKSVPSAAASVSSESTIATTTSSAVSVEGKSDEMISRFMNHESSPTTNSGLLCFFFAIHGLAVGGFVGAMKAKLI